MDLAIEWLPPEFIFTTYRNGDGNGWDEEFEWIGTCHYPRKLIADIAVNGIREPILLGDDGRVWDGHHRLYAAMVLGLEEVPTTRPRN
jgi:hypothetical protein